MVPEISAFPNQHIYQGRIKNGRMNLKPTSFIGLTKKFKDNSVLFMDIAYGNEKYVYKSYSNEE
jgi:superfamily I DNA and/or RNA helicase